MAEDPTSNAKFGPVIGLEAPGVDELQEGRPVITASGWDFNKPKQKILTKGEDDLEYYKNLKQEFVFI